MAQAHDVLLEHLVRIAQVRLVARLAGPELADNTRTDYLHVFVPDLHLLSDATRQQYPYGFDWRAEFSAVTTALLQTADALQRAGARMVVTQLGDFLDLWRESNNDPRGVADILEDFPDIRDRFVRLDPASLGARLLLGNHDLEVQQTRDFERARMVHYLPGTHGTVLATHGDAFDFWEILVPDECAAFVLHTLGRLAQPQTYDMACLRTLREQTTPKDQRVQIQGDAVYARDLASVSGPLPERFNLLEVHHPHDRENAHSLLPNAVRTAQDLRTRLADDAQPIAPRLRVIVIGHSHHARVVVDHAADLVLMDCGAWIEHYQVAGQAKRPNRQIGALCGADLRIYQLDAPFQV